MTTSIGIATAIPTEPAEESKKFNSIIRVFKHKWDEEITFTSFYINVKGCSAVKLCS